MEDFLGRGLGWQRDLKDARDYHSGHADVRKHMNELRSAPRRLPSNVDLREYLTSPADQGSLNASTAFAVLSLVEYFEGRHGRTLDGSPLFLYQMAMKLLRVSGNASVDLRTTFKALLRFGAPPDTFWPLRPGHIRLEPVDPFLFSFTREYAEIQYHRLDASDGKKTLQVVRSYLASGFVIAFGFSVPKSLRGESDIEFRPQFEAIRGGQAVMAVGYDDRRRIASDTGALLFRNSWGPHWGEIGFGWLPYAFVATQAAADFWTILRPDWLTSGFFTRPYPISSM